MKKVTGCNNKSCDDNGDGNTLNATEKVLDQKVNDNTMTCQENLHKDKEQPVTSLLVVLDVIHMYTLLWYIICIIKVHDKKTCHLLNWHFIVAHDCSIGMMHHYLTALIELTVLLEYLLHIYLQTATVC